jgi:8-hydroxy-5-deazaflavin:NADPH oxidoreductase
VITRSAVEATLASWVTSSSVCPRSRASRKRPSTSRAAAESRFPVGSSARTTSGLFASARASATRCCRGGEPVVLAAKDQANAAALAQELGDLARAASVEEAIAEADAVVLAVWLDTIKELIAKDKDLVEGKVVVDPSNPIGLDEHGGMTRTLPDDQSAGSVVAALLPTGAHYVKAFGTLGADSLASAANRDPRRAVLFYATDDDTAAAAIERLISAAGFDPFKEGV